MSVLGYDNDASVIRSFDHNFSSGLWHVNMLINTYLSFALVDDWSSPVYVDGYGLRDSSPSAAFLSSWVGDM